MVERQNITVPETMNELALQIYCYIYLLEKIAECQNFGTYLYFLMDDREVIAVTDITLDIYDIKNIARRLVAKKQKIYSFWPQHICTKTVEYIPYDTKIIRACERFESIPELSA